SAGPKEMVAFIKAMKPFATAPLVAKPNAGLPQLKNGCTFFDMDPKKFAHYAKDITKHGANMIGGCCGTTPDHIRALKDALVSLKPKAVQRTSLSALTSARAHVILEDRKKAVIIGECINPTRRKALHQELLDEKTSLVRELAKMQEFDKAELLDVNVGAPGVEEKKSLPYVLGVLSVSSSLPLVIDSSDIVAVEKALRVYPGRALINSISAENKMHALLKVASIYGAMFVALPVSRQGVPKTFAQRKKVISFLVNAAKKYGFTKSDIVIDALVMAVSSLPNSALETLRTVRWCSHDLRCNTVVGLSNVSFGLPQRSLINSTFLYLLKQQGLSLAIANPGHLRDVRNKKAEDVLLNKDKEARGFIAYCNKEEKQAKNEMRETSSPKELIFNAVLDGNREQIKDFIRLAEKEGFAPEAMIHQMMIPAINRVGEFFEQKRYFLPQLVASAEAMKIAFDYLEPKLAKNPMTQMKKTVVILATVKGDIHDIGKNIVALMLKNHGFSVVDLGKDVSSTRILNEIKKHPSPIVALSALMTTTMVNMPQVISLAKSKNLKCRFMLGGAVVTREYAKSLGAEYSKDGVEAVSVAKRLSGQ
ncbi:MAG: cobalamin-dependent protein, partial [Candidatus Omnitrophota bacterium]